MDKDEFIKEVDKHLSKKDTFIAVFNGNTRLAKDSMVDKFNYTKDDVIKEAGSIEQFIKSLPSKGFGNGSKMLFRKKRGTGKENISETDLQFSNSGPAPISAENIAMAAPENHAPANQYVPPPPAQRQPQQAAPLPYAMGYTQVQHSELVTLKVQEARYADIIEQKTKAERDRDNAESELRILKEEKAALERKLDTIDEKHLLALERQLASKKGFLDTEAGQEALKMGVSILPQLAASLKGNSMPPAMGHANQQQMLPMNPKKEMFINAMKVVPENLYEIIEDLANAMMEYPEFKDHLEQMLDNLEPNEDLPIDTVNQTQE